MLSGSSPYEATFTSSVGDAAAAIDAKPTVRTLKLNEGTEGTQSGKSLNHGICMQVKVRYRLISKCASMQSADVKGNVLWADRAAGGEGPLPSSSELRRRADSLLKVFVKTGLRSNGPAADCRS